MTWSYLGGGGKVINNTSVCIRLIFGFCIIFMFVIVQQKLHSLYSGLDTGRVTTRVLGSQLKIKKLTLTFSNFTNIEFKRKLQLID